ncbi:NAD(P)H-binding protein [Novosphingobium sp. B 225]|uniref:NAD(P)H-binding protein n=1 Tax=Novosphingobium sp. B 225 TaxID=1961849 RepID=UPI000B4BCC26|nr:NAD(P)H-binding protein [Novosphingobium sp. B 225]
MSDTTRIALVGASGLIGQSLIRLAVGRGDVRIIAVARREVPLPKGARMEVLVADPENWANAIAAANASVLVSALGTTWKKSGKDEAAFRSVDQDLVLACAKAAKDCGMRQMIAVSSVGADAGSKNFYLRVKGEVEQQLAKVGLPRLDVLRPGLLRGARGELRPAERLGMVLSPLADLLMQGQYSKYRSIHADMMARAIVGLTREKAAGRFVFEHDALVRAARRGEAQI